MTRYVLRFVNYFLLYSVVLCSPFFEFSVLQCSRSTTYLSGSGKKKGTSVTKLLLRVWLRKYSLGLRSIFGGRNVHIL